MLAMLSGGLIGLSLGATGSGGSLLAIPLLVYVLGAGAQEAVAMSLIVVAASAWLGVYGHAGTGEVRVRAALVFGSTGIFGAWLGAFGHQLVREELILLSFGVLMIIAASQMWLRARLADTQPSGACAEQFPRTCWIKVSSLGLGVGLLSGFFGIGGGFVIVPSLAVILGFPIRLAVGTSLLIIALISLGGIAGHLQFGGLDWNLTGLLLLGSAAGILVGTKVGKIISPAVLSKAFAISAMCIAVALIVHNAARLVNGTL